MSVGDREVSPDDFIETGAFDAPTTLIPERPSRVMDGPADPDEFTRTAVFENKDLVDHEANLRTSTLTDDIFDVTGSPGEIPDEATVVLKKSPLHVPDSGSKPPLDKPR